MPLVSDADSFGDLLFFSSDFGWTTAQYTDTQEMIEEHKCTHWTWTPEAPVVKDYELDSTRTEYLRNTGWLKD